MAACVSSAAASMLRLRSNSSVTWVRPSVLSEVIDVTPAMVENCRSSGAATDTAMVSGLAPGCCTETVMGGPLEPRNPGERQLPIAKKSRQQQGGHEQRGHDRAA